MKEYEKDLTEYDNKIKTLNRTIMQMKIKRENDGKKINMMN